MSTETTPAEKTGHKTHADVAYLLRFIERGISYDRLPAPISINVSPKWGSTVLRFDNGDDVRAWAGPTGSTVVTGRHVFDKSSATPWHEVSTEQGGKEGQLAGWRVKLWASVDGVPLIEGPKSWTCPYCPFTTTDVDAGMGHVADREAGKGCVPEPPTAARDYPDYGRVHDVDQAHAEAILADQLADARALAATEPLTVDAAIAAAEALEPKDTGRTAECGCHIFQDPLKDDPEVIHDTACQDWWFTFGSGQTHPDSPAVNPEGGESLADRYVVIRGTYESARAIMLRFFGRAWCDQYGSAERAGVARFGLTELHRRHWPTPATTLVGE